MKRTGRPRTGLIVFDHAKSVAVHAVDLDASLRRCPIRGFPQNDELAMRAPVVFRGYRAQPPLPLDGPLAPLSYLLGGALRLSRDGFKASRLGPICNPTAAVDDGTLVERERLHHFLGAVRRDAAARPLR
jgi:hypothetical protein